MGESIPYELPDREKTNQEVERFRALNKMTDGGESMEEDISLQVKEALNAHLVRCFKKSGLKINEDFLKDIVVLRDGANKLNSIFLGVYELPGDDSEKGRIVLHIDAISDYCDYIKRDFFDVSTKVFFVLIHNYMRCMAGKKHDNLRAEKFAAKICKKLLKQGILSKEPPIFNIDYEDKNMYYQILLRQQWMQKWTGMSLDEMTKEIFGD